MEYMALILFVCICAALLIGYPVALTLAGTSLLFAGIGVLTGSFDPSYLHAMPSRLYGILTNTTLIAVPLFVFMGVLLEKSKIAEQLLNAMSHLLSGRFPAGMAVSVVLVGMLLAASTGIVGATVVTMGLLSLPSMMKKGYTPELSTGLICATGTLGQIIPPSIALVLLGDVLSSAYQQAQLNMGIFSPDSVSVGDLFVGAVIPGMILVVLYMLYVIFAARTGSDGKAIQESKSDITSGELFSALLPPLLLIVIVLGAIIAGFATPTEAAGVGAMGAFVLAVLKRALTRTQLMQVLTETSKITSMVFLILIGASIFSLVFRGFGGEELIQGFFESLPCGAIGAMLVVMLVVFLLGFILDFIEITFVVVPIVAPVLLMMGLDPVWLGIMLAVNLQTSFLTPPFGFALFYLRGVAPPSIKTAQFYKGVIPFIGMQLLLLALLFIWPEIATFLPDLIY
jgi:tripartite ATP-independent transporter DctM subunit